MKCFTSRHDDGGKVRVKVGSWPTVTEKTHRSLGNLSCGKRLTRLDMFRKLQHDAELTEIRSPSNTELLLNLPCLDEHTTSPQALPTASRKKNLHPCCHNVAEVTARAVSSFLHEPLACTTPWEFGEM
ncbi:hypothetical protein Q7C36_020389 [Tachysurus vachellii]|uniref:Uncharacterized protein n=1 Tax=Tachysurus vachellii TaxID=175792 RepID=A0AA88S8U5_TACVA|nr:hypothetical protein Q7C36_020389 [Tachysurus vachellii]